LSYVLRGRAMRALAARRGYEYVGPPTPRLIFFYMPKVKPRLPLSRAWYPANEIRQAWNVIEGHEGGVRVVIFDSYIWWLGSRGQYITFLACQTEQSPFGTEIGSDPRYRVTQAHGWTVLYRVPLFLMNPLTTWGMSIQSLEHQLNELRTSEPATLEQAQAN
jgi:hypothetical protein